MTPDSPLTGVAALADRPVDGRRVALVMGIVGFGLTAAFGGGAELLLRGANARPEGSRVLARLADDGPTPDPPTGHLALVLVDGLRVDEANELPTWRALTERSTTGRVRLGTPTLSRPFYHHLFTGVPADISGVRTNRFSSHARHDSVMDRVRAAGGRVFISADGLDWMRTMHGAPADGGSDARGALGPPLDAVLEEWRRADPPALLVVHYVDTDATAHADGVHSAAHARALVAADALIARVAESAEDATLWVLSDHGHRDHGGHGGDEPEVARAPILVRLGARPRAPAVIEEATAADALAPSLALALGVPRPRAALAPPLAAFAGRSLPADPWPIRAASVAHMSRALEQERLSVRRRRVVPLVLLALLMALGPIKRGFGFDRSILVAASVPALVVLGHLALGRPISLSAIDQRGVHVARIFGLGVASAALAMASARLLSKGDGLARTRRVAATAGWSAAAFGLLACAGAGFSLGPWALSARMFYLPLLACGAAAGALFMASAVLLGSVLWDRR